MRRTLVALLIALAVLAGCGSAPHKAPVLAPVQQKCLGAPGPLAGAGCRPEGFSPASAPKVRTLSGSSIHIDGAGLHLIEEFEGYRQCAYWDQFGGVETVGFGQTRLPNGHAVYAGFCFSGLAAATANLKDSVEREYQWAVRALGVSFNQNQIDALDSFAYNLGAGIFTGSLRSAIQRHDPSALLAYDHAGGVVLSGLYTRRHQEVALFLKPVAVTYTRAQAARDIGYRRALRAVIARHSCKPRSAQHGYWERCVIWRHEGAAVNSRLHAHHIR